MAKGNLNSVWLGRWNDCLGVRVNRSRRKSHYWRVRDMTDASYFRLRRVLGTMRVEVRFDDDTVAAVYYPLEKGTGR